jgi:riboflavin synthase
MFTGLVEALGTIDRVDEDGAGRHLFISGPEWVSQLAVGESVAVNGVCLTVVELVSPTQYSVLGTRHSARFQAGPETLRRTNLGDLAPDDRVNLERSLRLGDRLGGHIVQGHVDGVGHLAERQRQGDWEMVWFACPPELAREMVSKGSVAVDGVSLTLVDVGPDRFSVALIPHTLANTTLGLRAVGDTVNLETDLFAKYVRKWAAQILGERAPES